MPQLNIRSGWQSSPPTLDNDRKSTSYPSTSVDIDSDILPGC